MSRLLTTMAEVAALCSAAALALFVRGGVLSVVGGAVVGVMAVLLWLATLGLARDPQARAAVAARTAGTRTGNFDVSPAVALAAAHPGRPVDVEEVSRGDSRSVAVLRVSRRTAVRRPLAGPRTADS